jgi:DNA-binding transcriptional LysR family regulator
VTLSTSDHKIDLYDGRFDLAVRIRMLPDSELKARKIGELRIVTFGSPAYFSKHGRPGHPDELERHECIVRNADSEAERWWFRIRGKREPVRVSGRFHPDDTAAIHVAAAAGLGIGMAPFWQIQPLLRDRVLEVVLQDFELPKLPIVIVAPRTKQPSVNARLFTDMLAASLKRERDL